jgi:PDZ domain
MMATARKQPQQPSQTSSLSFANERRPPIKPAAAKGAQLLVKLCRLRKGMPDPHAFVLAIAYVLNEYSDDVIKYIVDPAHGLPGSLKFPLEIADVQRACSSRELTLSVKSMKRPSPSSKAWLGIQIEKRRSLPLGKKDDDDGYVTILQCDYDGPTIKAGVRHGDRISREVYRQLCDRVDSLKPGDHVKLRVLRVDQELEFEVILGEFQ